MISCDSMRRTGGWRRVGHVLALAALLGPTAATWQAARADIDVNIGIRIAPKLKGELVDVSLGDDGIRMPGVLEEGRKVFRITNHGTVPHTVQVQGRKKVWTLGVAVPPRSTVLMSVKLSEGTYLVRCPIQGHESEGAVQVLVIDD